MRTYDFYLHGENGRKTGDRISLPSVTSIIGAVLAKPQLVPWAYSSAVDAVSGIVSVTYPKEEDHPHPSLAQWAEDLYDTFEDHETLDEFIRANGLHYDNVLTAAAERGHLAHGLLETLAGLYADPLKGADAAQEYAERMHRAAKDPFKKAVAGWWIDRQPRPRASEKVVYNLQYRYAGRLDLIADLPLLGYNPASTAVPPWAWGTSVIDLKTRRAGLGAYKSDEVQLSGYRAAAEEMGVGEDGPRMGKVVLLAQDDGSWLEVESTLPDEAFLRLAEVYYLLRRTRVE